MCVSLCVFLCALLMEVCCGSEQKLNGVLEHSRPRLGQLLEAGLWLRGVGCREVGVATKKLEARWNRLHKRLDRDRKLTERNRKLFNRWGKAWKH